MDRRSFLQFALLGANMRFDPTKMSGASSAAKRHWMWMRWDPDYRNDDWQRLFSSAAKAGIHALLPEVYNSEYALYQSGRIPVRERWLETILPLAAAEGLEVHAWMWMMPCNRKDIIKDHPEWFAVNRNGEPTYKNPAYVDYYKFLCPSQPGVHDYLRENVSEMASMKGVAGVHLDYIRYPDVILAEFFQEKYGIVQDKEYPPYDYCYCDVCVEAFQKEGGTDPRAMEDPAANAEWRRFRYRRVTRLVNETLVPAIRSKGKTVSAAVFPNWESVRQEWTTWDLDAFFPMLYHGFYRKGIEWIGEQTSWGVKGLGGRAQLYSGLFVPDIEPRRLKEAVQSALRGGASGVCLFSASALSDEHWKELGTVLRGT